MNLLHGTEEEIEQCLQGELQCSGWVEEQNKRTLENASDFSVEMAEAQAIIEADKPPRSDQLSRFGPFLFEKVLNKKYPRGLWRRCRLEQALSVESSGSKDRVAFDAAVVWETLIDLQELSEKEAPIKWSLHAMPQVCGRRALVLLSDGGKDERVVREFDLETHQFLDEGVGSFR